MSGHRNGHEHDTARRGETMTGAQQPRPLPRGARRRRRLRHPRRRDPPALRPADGLPVGAAHPRPPRAGRGPRGRGLRPRDRPGRRLHGDVRPGRDQPRHADRRRLHGLGADGRDHRPGGAARRSARTPSRRRTSPASPCRSPSTTTWSPTRRTSRARSPRRSTSPAPADPARSSSTSPRTRCRPSPGSPWPDRIDLPGYRPVARPHGKQVREAARLLMESRRPVLYVGGGVIKARASAELRRLADLTGAPVVTTLMARGALPDSHPQHLGMPGMHGTVAAVTALQKADLIVSLGARFDDRVTGKLSSFAPDATIVHADIDPAEISKNRVADVPIVGDAKDVIAELVAALRGRGARRAGGRTSRPGGRSWTTCAAPTRSGTPSRPPARSRRSTSSSGSGRSPGPRRCTSAGVGQHQMWASQFIRYEHPNTLDQLRRRSARWASRCRPRWAPRSACPTASVWAIDGDGCFQMTNQELATCVDQRHPDQGRGDQQLQPRAWSGSGRRSSTTSGTPTPTCTRPPAAGASPTSSSSPTPTAASACAASAPRTSTRRSRRRWRSTTSRSWSTSSCTATRWCGRWCRPA